MIIFAEDGGCPILPFLLCFNWIEGNFAFLLLTPFFHVHLFFLLCMHDITTSKNGSFG